jgi:hypothetical protein
LVSLFDLRISWCLAICWDTLISVPHPGITIAPQLLKPAGYTGHISKSERKRPLGPRIREVRRDTPEETRILHEMIPKHNAELSAHRVRGSPKSFSLKLQSFHGSFDALIVGRKQLEDGILAAGQQPDVVSCGALPDLRVLRCSNKLRSNSRHNLRSKTLGPDKSDPRIEGYVFVPKFLERRDIGQSANALI